jgi:hypothetical protein
LPACRSQSEEHCSYKGSVIRSSETNQFYYGSSQKKRNIDLATVD